jgi:hypothetical protein
MRGAMIMVALAICGAAAPAGPAPTDAVQMPHAPKPLAEQSPASCPQTTSYFAGTGSAYQGDRIAPKKLTELPPAVGYMAVYRTMDGCEVPMTVVEYRNRRL